MDGVLDLSGAKNKLMEELHKQKRNQTNADRIHSMSDEELAKLLVYYDSSCACWFSTVIRGQYWLKKECAIEAVVKWLQTEVEG